MKRKTKTKFCFKKDGLVFGLFNLSFIKIKLSEENKTKTIKFNLKKYGLVFDKQNSFIVHCHDKTSV